MIRKFLNIVFIYFIVVNFIYSQRFPKLDKGTKQEKVEKSNQKEFVSTEKKEISGFEVVEVIDDFESQRLSKGYWYGSGKDALVKLKVVEDIKKGNCIKAEYSFYTDDWNENWISISREFSPIADFSKADGISLWVKGSGSEGTFVVALKDNKNNVLEYHSQTVLYSAGWSNLVIPFNLFNLTSKITIRGIKEFDFSKVVGMEFYISLPDRIKRELPISGICFIDQVELVRNIITTKSSVFSKIPNGYLYSEYYNDTEVGNGVYQSLILSDVIHFNDKVAVGYNLRLPSMYVISGYAPSRKIDWCRGDDIKLINRKEYSVGIGEIYLKIKNAYKYIDNLQIGSAFLRWNPLVFYDQSKNLGITLNGTIASGGDYETFVGGDYWKRVLFFGNRFVKKTKTASLSPMFILGRQFGKEINSGEIVPVVDFYVIGIEFKKKVEITSLKLYETNLFVTAANMSETTFGLWRKESAWDTSLSYDKNLEKVSKGGVLLEKLFDKPSVMTDSAVIATLQANKISSSLFSFVLEGRYLGKNYGGVLTKDTLLPWMIEDKPPNLMNIEKRLIGSILEQKYYLVPSGYLDTGYVDQQGANFKLFYNKGKGIELKGLIDYANRISKNDITSVKTEVSVGYSKDNQPVSIEASYGINYAYEKTIEKNKINYYEVDTTIKPLKQIDFNISAGYRVEEKQNNVTKQSLFVGSIIKPLPFVQLDFSLKQSTPDDFELGGTVASVRDGDYKIWANHMPDNYTYLQLKIFF
ncbi:MAG: CIA30 family protein [Endomicrobia bacterium]|nr:CIA30 family protein [Endomicrobiia bacterium]